MSQRQPAYYAAEPRSAPDTELTKVVKDVSIVAVIVVIAIIIIVVFSVYLIVRFLRGVVDEAGKYAPTVECAAWLEMRRQGYLGAGRPPPPPTNPATGNPYTDCEAAAQAVLDAQSGSGGMCPAVSAPPPAAQQYPYLAYLAAQRCAQPPL